MHSAIPWKVSPSDFWRSAPVTGIGALGHTAFSVQMAKVVHEQRQNMYKLIKHESKIRLETKLWHPWLREFAASSAHDNNFFRWKNRNVWSFHTVLWLSKVCLVSYPNTSGWSFRSISFLSKPSWPNEVRPQRYTVYTQFCSKFLIFFPQQGAFEKWVQG